MGFEIAMPVLPVLMLGAGFCCLVATVVFIASEAVAVVFRGLFGLCRVGSMGQANVRPMSYRGPGIMCGEVRCGKINPRMARYCAQCGRRLC